MREDRPELRFSSRMSRREGAAALMYLPIHVLLMPVLLSRLFGQDFSQAELNFIVYAAGLLYMLVCQWGFLRREFDALCDNPLFILLEIMICYGMMLGFNLLINGLLAGIGSLLSLGDGAEIVNANPNNSAVLDMSGEHYGMVAASAIFLAPILEELMFRGGVFGLLRRRSRLLAYLCSIGLFALYHVWPYAVHDPLNWLFLLQYLPISYLLCRCYERSNSIWAGIFLHMLVNFISLRMLRLVQELL